MAERIVADREPDRLVRCMGLTHEEFRRSLPAAAPGMSLDIEGTRIRLLDAARWVEIRLGPQRQHRLGSLVLPQTQVTLHLEGLSTDERSAFLKRFDVAFQRGGG